MAPALADSAFAWYIQSVGSVQLGAFLPDASAITSDPRIIQYANEARDGHDLFVADMLDAAQSYAQWSDPGVWQSIAGFTAAQTVSVTFPANLTAFQIFNGDGSLCATVFNVVEGTTLIFTCSLVPTNASQVTNDGIQAFAAEVMQASAAYFASHYNDTLYTDARAGTLSTFLAATLVEYLYGVLTGSQQNLRFRSVPADPLFVLTGLKGFTSAPFDVTPGFDAPNPSSPYRFDPAVDIVPQTIANGTTFAQYWDYLTYLIVVKHTWPYNPVWNATIAAANVSASGPVTCRAFDVTNELDRVAVKNYYYAILAPRRCTSDVQCNTFYRGASPTCKFDATRPKGWLNGDEAVQEENGVVAVGQQGGCNCWHNATLGFMNYPAMCIDCVPGWGPSTNAEWGQVNAYQRALQALLPNEPANSFLYDPAMFVGVVPLCKLPFDRHTDGLLCGGRGSLSMSSYSQNVSLVVFPNAQITPPVLETASCLSLVVGSEGGATLSLASPLWTVDALRYAGGAGTNVSVSVLDAGEVFWVDSTFGDASVRQVELANCDQPLQSAWVCDFVDLDDGVTIVAADVACVNDVAFSPPPYHVDLVGYELDFERWVSVLDVVS